MKVTKGIAALVFGLFLSFSAVVGVSAQDNTMTKQTDMKKGDMKEDRTEARMTKKHHHHHRSISAASNRRMIMENRRMIKRNRGMMKKHHMMKKANTETKSS